MFGLKLIPHPFAASSANVSNGEPTGILREGASGLVSRIVPPYSAEEVSEAFDFAVTVAPALGITSLTDPGVGQSTVDMYAAKLREGKLPLRVNLMLGSGPSYWTAKAVLDGFSRPRGVDPRWLRVGEVKVMGVTASPRRPRPPGCTSPTWTAVTAS